MRERRESAGEGCVGDRSRDEASVNDNKAAFLLRVNPMTDATIPSDHIMSSCQMPSLPFLKRKFNSAQFSC